MELETDDMRLAAIETLGGVCVFTDAGSFTAIFDNGYGASGADPVVEGTEPHLTARTSDITKVALRKSVVVRIDETPYRVVRVEPDGTGMSAVILKTP